MRGLVRKSSLAEWYTRVVLEAELADYAPVKGCMVIRPYGFALWENIREVLDREFKATGHRNVYFPLFIPESFLQREKEHIKGFAPQCAWVERGGEEELQERLAIRPTSEAIICSMFAKWVKSYRDLPVLINQWVNVVRWEKATRLFLRTTEFLWQEGHTLHRTPAEAEEEALRILEIYRRLCEESLALAVLCGIKPESEKFAGAEKTYTLEALLPDGQALQAGTSHVLGQNFSRAFEIKYLDSDNREKYPYGTSWGVSTRLIGALVMTHGDDKGLFLPPAIAPIKVVIVPIFKKGDNSSLVAFGRELKEKIEEVLKTARGEVFFDEREEFTPGWKFNEWEMRGVPLRVEVGEKEFLQKEITLKERVGERYRIKLSALEELRCVLSRIQERMHERAREFLSERTSDAETLEEFKRRLEERPGFVRVYSCSSCEERIREETKTTPRLIPISPNKMSRCIVCGEKTGQVVYYARAY